MATDVYARVITRNGIPQFEVPIMVLDMLGIRSIEEMIPDIPAGGEFIYFRPMTITEKDIEKKEQMR